MTHFSFPTFVHVDKVTCFGGRDGMASEKFATVDFLRDESADYMRHAI